MRGDRGWVMFFWALENEATMMGTGLRRSGDGYIGRHAKQSVRKTKPK